MNTFSKELVGLVVLLSASVLLVNPFHFWMPSMLHMSMLALVVAAAGAIAIFMIREKIEDERDEVHRAHAGRAAFFAGSVVLLVAITAQTFAHTLDPWLVTALITMVAAKTGARWWSARNS